MLIVLERRMRRHKAFCSCAQRIIHKVNHSHLFKDFYNPGNHDGVITHLEPDILECEVKWAVGSITMNKASGGDGIPVELF